MSVVELSERGTKRQRRVGRSPNHRLQFVSSANGAATQSDRDTHCRVLRWRRPVCFHRTLSRDNDGIGIRSGPVRKHVEARRAMTGSERDHLPSCGTDLSALTADWWSIGGLLVGASVPFTLFVMMPVNNGLLDENVPATADEAASLLRHWGSFMGSKRSFNPGFGRYACEGSVVARVQTFERVRAGFSRQRGTSFYFSLRPDRRSQTSRAPERS